MKREGITEREARRQIQVVEADRKAFLMKHFHTDFDDPIHFDLVVNTTLLGIANSSAAICAAVERLRPVTTVAASKPSQAPAATV
jgi:cytidylate kinase